MNAKKLLKLKLSHGAGTLDKILRLSEERFSEIINDAYKIFDEEELFSKAIERVAEKYNGNEFILALLTIAFAKSIEYLEECLEDIGEAIEKVGNEVRYIG